MKPAGEAVKRRLAREDAMRRIPVHVGGWLVGLAAVAALLSGAAGWAGEPDIQYVEPEDDPSAGESASPFSTTAAGGSNRPDAVPGYVELSNGLKVPGRIYTTRAKRLKIYNLDRQVYEYVPVPALGGVEAVIEWARVDKQWRFKEAGSTEKVYTGESYPVRMLAWRLILRNGHAIVGHILGEPLYVEHNEKRERFILHKRQKGPLGESLDDLVYVQRVAFGPKAYNEAVDELAKKAGKAAAGEAP
jgi:hypothetical protein